VQATREGKELMRGLICKVVKKVLTLRSLWLASLSFVALTAQITSAQPQLPEPPLPMNPTPLSELLSPAERASVTQADNPKKKIDLYIHIGDSHLESAGNAVKANNAGVAESELDIYNKAMAEASKLTLALGDGKRPVAKKLEQALYKQIRSLENIDRLFPTERIGFAEDALKRAKQLRVQALNAALAAGEVLNDPDAPKKPATNPDGTSYYNSPRPTRFDNLEVSASTTSRASAHFVPAIWNPHAQIAGDYMTEEEDDHVREAQSPDERIKVFMKIADRRIAAIVGSTATRTEKSDPKKDEKEEREWGKVPKLSRTELLRHYARAIEESMAKLEDAYERNPKATALTKALGILRDGTGRQLQALRSLGEVSDEAEAAALKNAIEEAETANKGARDGIKGKPAPSGKQ
jgi:hypothetical protein